MKAALNNGTVAFVNQSHVSLRTYPRDYRYLGLTYSAWILDTLPVFTPSINRVRLSQYLVCLMFRNVAAATR